MQSLKTKCLQITARGRIRPTKPFYPAREAILWTMEKIYMYEKCVDLMECNTSRNYDIT